MKIFVLLIIYKLVYLIGISQNIIKEKDFDIYSYKKKKFKHNFSHLISSLISYKFTITEKVFLIRILHD